MVETCRVDKRFDHFMSGEIMRYLALVLLVLYAAPGTLQAQTMIPSLDEPGRKGDLARAAKQRSATQFDAMDEDKDGRLSRTEVAKHSRYLTDNFDKLDADKDGYLAWEEFLGHNRWPK